MDNVLSIVLSGRMPHPPFSTDDDALALTELILRIFRTNGRLIQAGDRLVAPLGLTSARWQVLGTAAAANTPQPVAGLAREMGVTRQAVQRVVNDLALEGLVTFAANPRHKRAQLVVLTERGRDLFDRALLRQRPWAEGLARGLGGAQIASARLVLDALLSRLTPTEDES